MRKIFYFGLLLTTVLVTAAEASYTERAADKFGRGLGNIVYSPAEIVLQTSNEMIGSDYVYAFPRGLAKGVTYGLGRLGVGVYETVTFAAPQEPIIPNFNQV